MQQKLSIPFQADPLTGAISVRLQTSTFIQKRRALTKVLITPEATTNRKVLEDVVAQLENGHSGLLLQQVWRQLIQF